MTGKVMVNPLVINMSRLSPFLKICIADLLHLFKLPTCQHPHLYTHANILLTTRNYSNRRIVEHNVNSFRLCNA